MSRTHFIRSNQFGSPQGVPSPYAMHTHPYATRYHGGLWVRPVFGFPPMHKTTSVLIPNYDYIPSNGPVNGLGWDVGDGVFKPGGYGGGVFDGNMSGLGSDATDYPWKQDSQKTLELQRYTNQALRSAGYCPLTEDGELGPATCGAREQLTKDGVANFSNPSTCQRPYTSPRKASSGCATASPSPSLPSPVTPTTPVTPVQTSMMSSSSKKALAFMVGGVAAAALVIYLKKKG